MDKYRSTVWVADECVLYHLFENIVVRIDEIYNIGELMTLQTNLIKQKYKCFA